jgi:hypothetical protein
VRAPQVVLAGGVVALVFLAFKAGFIRHDGHVLISAAVLALLGMLIVTGVECVMGMEAAGSMRTPRARTVGRQHLSAPGAPAGSGRSRAPAWRPKATILVVAATPSVLLRYSTRHSGDTQSLYRAGCVIYDVWSRTCHHWPNSYPKIRTLTIG